MANELVEDTDMIEYVANIDAAINHQYGLLKAIHNDSPNAHSLAVTGEVGKIKGVIQGLIMAKNLLADLGLVELANIQRSPS